ncbi:hypothetical protein ACRRTK_024742 [Alexandromys fortis]
MTAGTLYTYPENWRAFNALIAAQYSGAQVRVLSAPPHFHFGQTNRTPEFLRKFPAGKVPAFEDDGGFCVFESNAIAYYITWVFPTLVFMHHNKQATENAKEEAFPNTNRWFLICINQPQFRAVLGEVKLREKMAQFDAKKFAESQPKKDTPRKEKGSREEKQKPPG